jgi:dTDP-4-amino-4,6-dideoxygalactose transaminase
MVDVRTPPKRPKVPLINVARQTAAIRAELDEAIACVLDAGQFILGPEVAQLEEKIAEYCGAKYAIGCASGSDALLLPLLALKCGPGDSVITTPFTFFASAGSISRAGARPAFVDIHPATFNMAPEALSSHLESLSRSELQKVKAIMPIHLFGHCADMPAINEIAARYGIPVIEDAAQAIGAECGGVRAGTLGYCGCFSFFPTKNLGALGDGGIITTNDEELVAQLRLLRVHGSGTTYYHRMVGVNSRLDTLQAAVLLVKLKYLETWTEARRAHAAAYRSRLNDRLAGTLTLPVEQPGYRHIYNQFTIRVSRRDEIRNLLQHRGVSSAVYYPLPLHLQECFADLGYRQGDFPVSEAAANEVLSLPIEQGLTEEELATAIDAVETVARESYCEARRA